MTLDQHPDGRNLRPDRRTVLKTTGVALATGGLAGCLAGGQGGSGDSTTSSAGTATASDDATSNSDDAAANPKDTATESDSATTDSETTQPADRTATVEVGPGGRLTFEPSGDEPLVVASGTTVEFVWRSDTHNVVVDSQPNDAGWQGSPGESSKVYDKGYAFSHTFEVPGLYKFHCEPHETVGMTGAIFVTPEGVTPEFATADDLPVNLGADDDQKFSPGTVRPLKVPAGTEVGFVWESDDHNVVVESQPETGDWEGTPGDRTTLYDEGHEYSHTFEVPGVYWFYCQAHRSAGMVGAIVVEEG